MIRAYVDIRTKNVHKIFTPNSLQKVSYLILSERKVIFDSKVYESSKLNSAKTSSQFLQSQTIAKVPRNGFLVLEERLSKKEVNAFPIIYFQDSGIGKIVKFPRAFCHPVAFCHPDAYQDLEGEQSKCVRRSRNKFGMTPRKAIRVNVLEDPGTGSG